MATYKIKGTVKVAIGTSANSADVQIKPANGYVLDHEGKKYGILVKAPLIVQPPGNPVNPTDGLLVEIKDGYILRSFRIARARLISPLINTAVAGTVLMIGVDDSTTTWTIASLEIPG